MEQFNYSVVTTVNGQKNNLIAPRTRHQRRLSCSFLACSESELQTKERKKLNASRKRPWLSAARGSYRAFRASSKTERFNLKKKIILKRPKRFWSRSEILRSSSEPQPLAARYCRFRWQKFSGKTVLENCLFMKTRMTLWMKLHVWFIDQLKADTRPGEREFRRIEGSISGNSPQSNCDRIFNGVYSERFRFRFRFSVS